MGAQNAVMGNDSFGTDLPQTQVDETQLAVEQGMAKFSKSKEFKALKDYIDQRIKFYQTQLPGGYALEAVGSEPRGEMWLVANIVINEFNAITNAYEQAADTLREAAKSNAR